MKLTKILYQEKASPFQSLEIMVEYCTKTRAVEEVVSVHAYEFGKERIDLSDLFMQYFDSDLDKLIMETDWDMICMETKAELKEMYND